MTGEGISNVDDYFKQKLKAKISITCIFIVEQIVKRTFRWGLAVTL